MLRLARNEWPIVVAGPPTKHFVFKGKDTGDALLSMTGNVYPVAELRRWTPSLRGKPVFAGHPTKPARWGDGDPRQYDVPDVGYIKAAGFNEQHHRIQAVLKVTSHEWQSRFTQAWRDGTLNHFGFSWFPSVLEDGLVSINGRRFPKVEIIDVYSVDLVDEPLMGGRFMGVEPPHEWLASAYAWRDKNIGVTNG